MNVSIMMWLTHILLLLTLHLVLHVSVIVAADIIGRRLR